MSYQLSSNAMKVDRGKCLAAGMDDFVAKPIRLKVLHQVLFQWLVKRREDDPSSAANPPNQVPVH